MSDNELLLAMAELIDKKLESQLQPLKDDIRDIKLTIENNITPNQGAQRQAEQDRLKGRETVLFCFNCTKLR